MRLVGFVGGLSALVISAGAARGGGLLLPGSGAISTSRAGASVASVWGGDAIAINPAGIAIGRGTQITISAALIDYSLSFKRAGNYEATGRTDAGGAPAPLPWEANFVGQPYETVHDESTPPIGLGPFQAVPVIAIASDLGGLVPGLYVGGGLWAPNAYPSRSIGEDYTIDDPNAPPPPSRYDIVKQEASVLLPTIAVAYRVLPQLDFGARFAWGIAHVKARVFLWGVPQNFTEFVGKESIFDFEARDNFAPNFAFGFRFRPTSNIEVGGIWSSQINVNAKGTGTPTPSSELAVGGVPVVLIPLDPANPDPTKCSQKAGTMQKLEACTNFALPMLAKVGGRYIFRDKDGLERGDIELDVDWEHWSADRVSNYEVVVDAEAMNVQLKHTFIRHGWKDTFSFRLGGGYGFAVGPGLLTARGGVAYDTPTAKSGWERLDVDGAGRFMFAGGAGYRLPRWQVDVGFGYIHEGSRNNGRNPPCNPTINNRGCDGSGMETPIDDRIGPDPVNPIVELRAQNENPVNQGRYKSNYVLLALGVSTWF
jgi:long-subunit fatty acid transport protein